MTSLEILAKAEMLADCDSHRHHLEGNRCKQVTHQQPMTAKDCLTNHLAVQTSKTANTSRPWGLETVAGRDSP